VTTPTFSAEEASGTKIAVLYPEVDRPAHRLLRQPVKDLDGELLVAEPFAGVRSLVLPDYGEESIAEFVQFVVLETQMPDKLVGKRVEKIPAVTVQDRGLPFLRQGRRAAFHSPHMSAISAARCGYLATFWSSATADSVRGEASPMRRVLVWQREAPGQGR